MKNSIKKVGTKYGDFEFELVDSSNEIQLVNIYFNKTLLGLVKCCGFNSMSNAELLELSSSLDL